MSSIFLWLKEFFLLLANTKYKSSC